MSDDVLSALRDLASRDLSDEETARALLDLTLQAAPPKVADAICVCALPAWFDAELLALLTEPLSPPDEEPEGEQSLPPRRGELEEGSLLERIAAFSFVMPRQGGGYVYHEATRERLLDWWRKPENRPRFAALADRLGRHYLALAEEQNPRLGGPAYLEALSVLNGAYPNIRAAWEGVVEVGNEELVRDFAYAMHDYFGRRNLWSDWIAWTQAGLEACKHMGDEAGAAGMQNNLGNAYAQLPTADRGANLGRAIAYYEEALTVYTPEAAPFQYAATQNNLGNAYADLPTGERGANLAQAIACYEQALTVYTAEAAPLDYAGTQNNLGAAYAALPTGDRGVNLGRAIECYEQTLTVYTAEAAPFQYAATQNNLGNAYADLPTGERGANLGRAIACYEQALTVYTAEAALLDYAMTQNNLGNAYAQLPTGDRGANLGQAIECYQEALTVYTAEAAPLDYAMMQNNLGNAYRNLPTGERGANLGRAIGCYQEALTVYTAEAAPLQYAMTQNNLGLAYAALPTGERGANLARAIACYEQALRFRTAEAAPLQYAMTQNNLGNAYAALPTGERGANLGRAIECYQQALAIEHLSPWERMRYLRNLGDAYGELEDYPAAVAAYRQAIDLDPDDPWLFNALGNAYSGQEQHEPALEAYTTALTLVTADEDKALLYRNRANTLIQLSRLDEAGQDCEHARILAPDHPYTYDRLGNLTFARGDYSAAIEHYDAALYRQSEAGFYFDRGLAHLALGHLDQALTDYQAAIPLATAITMADALQELDKFAAGHPATPGLDTVRALFSK